jgi:hypothetical protein
VHLSSRGHRFVSYRAAEVLGLPDVEALGALDAALHAEEDRPVSGTWLLRDALPWVWRRLRGRTAGDEITAKHTDYIELPAEDQRADPRATVLRRASGCGGVSRSCGQNSAGDCAVAGVHRRVSVEVRLPERCCAFFLSDASLNLRFISSDAEVSWVLIPSTIRTPRCD